MRQRITTYVGSESFSVGVAYDTNTRPTTFSYPSIDGESFDTVNEFDSYGHVLAVRGAPNGVVDPTASPIWQFKEAFQGYAVSRARLGNNLETHTDIEASTGRIKSITASPSEQSGSLVQSLTYEYYDNGNLWSRTDSLLNAGAEKFEYDELDRLKKATRFGQAANNYYYDNRGNLTAKDGKVYTYDIATAFPHAVRAVDGTTFEYDAAGNQKRREGLVEGGLQRISYTSFNLPSKVETGVDGASTETTYSYDTRGRRVRKLTGNVATVFVGDAYERVRDAETGVETHRYSIFANGARVAQVQRRKTGGILGGLRTDFLLQDRLGSTSVVTDEAGNVVHRQEFDPWGANRNPELTEDGLRYGYTGHPHDAESGLVDMGGRMYDPALGRFLSADPIVGRIFDLQNHNRYSYVMNRPFAFTDPSGFEPMSGMSGAYPSAYGGGGPGSGGGGGGGLGGPGGGGGMGNLGPAYGGHEEGSRQVLESEPYAYVQGGGISVYTTFVGAAEPEPSGPAPQPSNPSGAKEGNENGGGSGATAPAAAPDGGQMMGVAGRGGSAQSAQPGPGAPVMYGSIPTRDGGSMVVPPGDALGAAYAAWGMEMMDSLLSDSTSGAHKVVSAASVPFSMLAEFAPLAELAAAESMTARAITAADLGLSGRGLGTLAGTVVDAGTTRIITVDMIEAAGGIPVSELRSAMPKMIEAARLAGVSTLQIEARFANVGLASFVEAQATKLGGTISSSAGMDTITFALGQ